MCYLMAAFFNSSYKLKQNYYLENIIYNLLNIFIKYLNECIEKCITQKKTRVITQKSK